MSQLALALARACALSDLLPSAVQMHAEQSILQLLSRIVRFDEVNSTSRSSVHAKSSKIQEYEYHEEYEGAVREHFRPGRSYDQRRPSNAREFGSEASIEVATYSMYVLHALACPVQLQRHVFVLLPPLAPSRVMAPSASRF